MTWSWWNKSEEYEKHGLPNNHNNNNNNNLYIIMNLNMGNSMSSLPSLNTNFLLNPSKIFSGYNLNFEFNKKIVYKDPQLPPRFDSGGNNICLFMNIFVCADSGLNIILTIKIIYSFDLNS